jgi:hypothetical protein
MATISVSVLEAALHASVDPLASDLVARLRAQAPSLARETRPYSRRVAYDIYQRKAAQGDPPWVCTDGYPGLLATLRATVDGQVIVHGVTFADVVYLVFTDPARQRCLGVLRKRRLSRGT